jgi:hypothetical protein
LRLNSHENLKLGCPIDCEFLGILLFTEWNPIPLVTHVPHATLPHGFFCTGLTCRLAGYGVIGKIALCYI